MTIEVMTGNIEEQLVREVLDAAGSRGASHEDFVEAGLAGDYIGILRRLVDDEGLEIRTDFTTGQARWVVDATRRLRAA